MFKSIMLQYESGLITREHAIATFVKIINPIIDPEHVRIALAMQDLFDDMANGRAESEAALDHFESVALDG